MSEVYVFEAKLTRMGGGRLGIYVPSWLKGKIEEHVGKKVIVHIYVVKW